MLKLEVYIGNCKALKLISRVASFKTRKTIANGLFIGKLSYLISVWGGTSKRNIERLQVVQNRAARLVTKKWQARTVDNLQTLSWLSVRQLAFYHTVLLMFKIKLSRTVRDISILSYLSNMFDWNYEYETRQAKEEKINQMIM